MGLLDGLCIQEGPLCGLPDYTGPLAVVLGQIRPVALQSLLVRQGHRSCFLARWCHLLVSNIGQDYKLGSRIDPGELES